MSRLRQGIAAGIVVVLAVVVVVVAFAPGDDPEPVSEAVATSTSTSTSASVGSVGSTSSSTSSTTSTTEPSDRVAEVQAVLQDLWFRWFDAIYRKDPDALWEVVATQRFYDAGVAAMGQKGLFASAPTLDGTRVAVNEILLDRPDCMAVWYRLDVTEYRGEGATTEKLLVLWPDPRYSWRMATAWGGPGDLWRNDCDLVTRPVLP